MTQSILIGRPLEQDFDAVYPVKSLDAPYGRPPPYGRWGYNNQNFDPFHHGGHMMALDYL